MLCAVGERTAYAPGTFCWADLATTDVEGAAAFYSALLGWEGDEMPAGDGMTYTMMRVGRRYVCGLSAMPESQRALGAPPAWLSYVSVEDADATAERAGALGATVMMPPLDVVDAGRMALVQDPQGAVLGLWQPRARAGAELVNDPGAMTINQLNTSDPDAAARFYGELFGWAIDQVSAEPQAYWSIENAGGLNGGMMALPPGTPAPPHWLVYFTVADLEASAAAIAAGRGQVVVPATPVPAGRFLVARDPQGAHFALFEGEVDP
jgi:predicted enzyme related to lactoylglutathione lyase